MWVVMRVMPFEFESGLPFPVRVLTSMVGYLPVYATQEAAEKDFPDAALIETLPAKTAAGVSDD